MSGYGSGGWWFEAWQQEWQRRLESGGGSDKDDDDTYTSPQDRRQFTAWRGLNRWKKSAQSAVTCSRSQMLPCLASAGAGGDEPMVWRTFQIFADPLVQYKFRNWCFKTYLVLESLQKFFCWNTSSGVDCEFHFTNFLVNFFHEVNDKINQLVLVHLLCVEICDQEADVVTLKSKAYVIGLSDSCCVWHLRHNNPQSCNAVHTPQLVSVSGRRSFLLSSSWIA